jgi:tetratricopeptide (TPR) repeat protein
VARARAHFDAGNAHYAAARYKEAIQEFQAGYALVPRSSFLVNLGQAYRKLGDLDRAKESYVAYLRSLPEDSPLRDQALRVLAEIEVQRQARGARVQPAEPPPPAPPVFVRKSAPTPAEPPSRAGRWVGVGLIAAGVGLAGAGLVFELRAKAASDELSDLDHRGGVYDPEKDRIGRRDETLGAVLLGAGGLATAAGVTVFLIFGPSDAPMALLPSLAPGGARGLMLKGSF